jgi:hypothetical protein
MRAFLLVLVAVLVVGAYLGGYLPERQSRLAAEAKLKTVQARLADAEAQVRLCAIQNRLLALIDRATEKNYGDALSLSTEFFDAVRKESGTTPRANVRAALEDVYRMRDSVTAALTKGEAASTDLLRQAMAKLHEVAGPVAVPVPPSPQK